MPLSVLGITAPALRPLVLERERYSRDRPIELALGYGHRWTRAWIEASTRFALPERAFGDDAGTAARFRLTYELDEWSQRRLLHDADLHAVETGTITIILPSGERTAIPSVSQSGIGAAALDLSHDLRVILCWTIDKPDAVMLNEEVSLNQYRLGAQDDAARRRRLDP